MLKDLSISKYFTTHMKRKLTVNFEWDPRDEEFNLNEQVSSQKKIPDLKLEISNQITFQILMNLFYSIRVLLMKE